MIFLFTATFPLISSSKLNPNSSLIAIRLATSGIPLSVSHLVIACLDTFNFTASCSCERPACFLCSLIFSPKLIFESSLFEICRLIIAISQEFHKKQPITFMLLSVAIMIFYCFAKDRPMIYTPASISPTEIPIIKPDRKSLKSVPPSN